jgi:hypothetical protein
VRGGNEDAGEHHDLGGNDVGAALTWGLGSERVRESNASSGARDRHGRTAIIGDEIRAIG